MGAEPYLCLVPSGLFKSTPLSPPSAPVQRRLHDLPAKRKSPAVSSRSSSRRWPHLCPRRLMRFRCVTRQGVSHCQNRPWQRGLEIYRLRSEDLVLTGTFSVTATQTQNFSSQNHRSNNQTIISAPLSPATPFLPHGFRQSPVSTTFPPKEIS